MSMEEDIETHTAREHNREHFAKEKVPDKKVRTPMKESGTIVAKQTKLKTSCMVVIDISEEEPHEEMDTIRVKKISRTPLPQEVIQIKPEIRGK